MLKARITSEIKSIAAEIGVRIIRVKTEKQARQVGIHLLCPTQRELENALDVAERDLFPVIFIHSLATWGFQFGKSYDHVNSSPAKAAAFRAAQV